ncbi:MAG TPA: hypothetical protein VI320_35040 [Terracidiphilus sp.]
MHPFSISRPEGWCFPRITGKNAVGNDSPCRDVDARLKHMDPDGMPTKQVGREESQDNANRLNRNKACIRASACGPRSYSALRFTLDEEQQTCSPELMGIFNGLSGGQKTA